MLTKDLVKSKHGDTIDHPRLSPSTYVAKGALVRNKLLVCWRDEVVYDEVVQPDFLHDTILFQLSLVTNICNLVQWNGCTLN